MPESTLLIAAIIVLLAVVMIFAIVARQRAERRRTESLRQVAADMGFEFDPGGFGALVAEHGGFPLFNQGHGRRAHNLLRRHSGDEAIWAFDYRYRTGGGQHQTTHQQTVAAFRLPALNLPQFALRPENIFHKIAAALGYQDIDFPDYPEFSSRYLLRGQNENAIRELFDYQRIDAVMQTEGLCVEGGGPCLIFYRARKRLPPEELPDFLGQAQVLRDTFLPHGR